MFSEGEPLYGNIHWGIEAGGTDTTWDNSHNNSTERPHNPTILDTEGAKQQTPWKRSPTRVYMWLCKLHFTEQSLRAGGLQYVDVYCKAVWVSLTNTTEDILLSGNNIVKNISIIIIENCVFG